MNFKEKRKSNLLESENNEYLWISYFPVRKTAYPSCEKEQFL